jgi:hypothetical protein
MDPREAYSNVGFRTVLRKRTATATSAAVPFDNMKFHGEIKMCAFNEYTEYECNPDP